MILRSFIIVTHTHTRTHTHIYIYIYILKQSKWLKKTNQGKVKRLKSLSLYIYIYILWSLGGSNDNTTTRKWVIRIILKENSTYINDNWEKPLLSLTQSWIWPFLVTARWDCSEESLADRCHLRACPSEGKTPQHSVCVCIYIYIYIYIYKINLNRESEIFY